MNSKWPQGNHRHFRALIIDAVYLISCHKLKWLIWNKTLVRVTTFQRGRILKRQKLSTKDFVHKWMTNVDLCEMWDLYKPLTQLILLEKDQCFAIYNQCSQNRYIKLATHFTCIGPQSMTGATQAFL